MPSASTTRWRILPDRVLEAAGRVLEAVKGEDGELWDGNAIWGRGRGAPRRAEGVEGRVSGGGAASGRRSSCRRPSKVGSAGKGRGGAEATSASSRRSWRRSHQGTKPAGTPSTRQLQPVASPPASCGSSRCLKASFRRQASDAVEKKAAQKLLNRLDDTMGQVLHLACPIASTVAVLRRQPRLPYLACILLLLLFIFHQRLRVSVFGSNPPPPPKTPTTNGTPRLISSNFPLPDKGAATCSSPRPTLRGR